MYHNTYQLSDSIIVHFVKNLLFNRSKAVYFLPVLFSSLRLAKTSCFIYVISGTRRRLTLDMVVITFSASSILS